MLLHFRSREHVSTCFHFAFYKADFRLCRDPFPRLPFVINKGFFPFSQLRPCQTDEPRRLQRVLPRRWGRAKPLSFLLQHLCCCHGPAAEQQSRQQLQSHRSRYHGVQLLPTPQALLGKRASYGLLSLAVGRQGHGKETDASKIFALPASDTVSSSITNTRLCWR